MTLPKAIICDLDGTLCDHRHRLHFVDKDAFSKTCPFTKDTTASEVSEWIEKCNDWKPDYHSFYSAMDKDEVNKFCRFIINCTQYCTPTIFITGRPKKYRQITQDWIFYSGVFTNVDALNSYKLFMRPDFLPCEIPNWKSGHLLKPSEHDDRCFIDYDGSIKSRRPDHRSSHEIKREIYEREVRGKYEVLFVLDDSEKCCEMYRELGLQVLRVM